MKIAVIAVSGIDFKEYVKRSGASTETAKIFLPVYSNLDVRGLEFDAVLFTPRAETHVPGFWELLHVCKMRIRVNIDAMYADCVRITALLVKHQRRSEVVRTLESMGLNKVSQLLDAKGSINLYHKSICDLATKYGIPYEYDI